MTRWHPLPAEVYALVEQTPATVLLEGRKPQAAQPGQQPWTQLFVAPKRICAAYNASQVMPLFAEIESAVANGDCAAGFFTYECGTSFEPKATPDPPREGQPLAWFGVYQRSYAFDHAAGAFIGGEPPELTQFRASGEAVTRSTLQPPEPAPEIAAEFALSEADYTRRIAAIHEYIGAGDVYQLNFTAPFRVQTPGSVASLYTCLRARQPVDYGAFIHWKASHQILSFSPELFFRVDHAGEKRSIVTRPMKGTAQRGRTTAEDRQIAEWLRNDAKNRAENLMIVDLLRNDLGRIAQFGSVRAENLFAVERYQTLWQMTSTISAGLRPEIGFHDIFRALFPCGSVTGAPKVRAMQLIAELEEQPRGIYTGAIGFFSQQQTIFNVAIRTLELSGGRGVMGAGSGIVIDSDPAEEFRECLLKAEFLTRAAGKWPQQFSLIETMLWDGDYPLLELHLDRLVDSAEYFGFACDRDAVRTALLERAGGFADRLARKTRLLLNANGEIQVSDEILRWCTERATADPSLRLPHIRNANAGPQTYSAQNDNSAYLMGLCGGAQAGDGRPIGRVLISDEKTDSADVMLYHKTTHRPIYTREFERAMRDGFDDVLFLNQRGEVTEGAISSVFVEKNGRWLTPPIACGLLPGVYRRHLLATRPEIEERILLLDDLRSADAVYLTNAVRGLRKVTIDW
jgi:para-aminobenzoate synthetase / 4-amino-4-deoxychorismate lyase